MEQQKEAKLGKMEKWLELQINATGTASYPKLEELHKDLLNEQSQ